MRFVNCATDPAGERSVATQPARARRRDRIAVQRPVRFRYHLGDAPARPDAHPGGITMTRHIVAVGLLCLLAAGCNSSDARTAGGNGLLPGRLERIDSAIEQAIDDGRIAGAVALVRRDGQTVYHEAFGSADLASGAAMRTDSIFRIASMTKAITSVAVMQLYERGDFRLGDPVGDYLPEFAEMQVIETIDDDGLVTATRPAEEPIRIIHLLTHTSGIAYPFMAGQLDRTYRDAGIIDGLTTQPLTLAAQMELLAAQPLLFEPGERFNYGLNTDVLGRLVEVVSGQPLDEYFAEHVTGPLGMRDTHFYLPDASAERLVRLYAYDAERGLVAPEEVIADIAIDEQDYPVTGARSYFSGGAGLSSTASDYARFTSMLLNEGELDGARILSRKSVELMRAPRVDSDGDGDPEIGLGFWIVTDLGDYGALGSEGAYSWGGAFYTSYWIDPAENLTAVFMAQVYPADTDIAERFRTLVYQALE